MGRNVPAGWLIAVAIVVVLALVGVAVAQSQLRRGADTPRDAVQELSQALASQDWRGAARLLPPDEVDWARDVLDELVDQFQLAGAESDGDAELHLEAELGEPEELVAGIQVVPILSMSADIAPESALGRAGMATEGREVEDLRDDPTAIVVLVERSGRWYVSPVGTLLEVIAMEDAGLDGATPSPRPRSGAGDPEQVVELVARALAGTRFDDVLALLDPEELQVLDHYVHVLDAVSGGGVRLPVDARTRTEGSDVVLERVGVLGQHLDLRDWCFHGELGTGCAADELGDDPLAAVARELLDISPEVRIGTVERDGEHYLSLERTLEATVVPLLTRLDAHGLAILFDLPRASPYTPDEPVALGESTTLPLRDGWSAVTVAGGEGPAPDPALACAGSTSRRLDEVSVDGYEVRTRPVSTGSGDLAYLVYLQGAPRGTSASVDVRFVDERAGDC